MAYSDEVLIDAPMIYMRLGGADSTSIKTDSSGTGRNANTLYGTAPTYQSASLLTSDTVDKSCTFPADSGLFWTANTGLNVASITLEAWIKPTNISGNIPMIWGRHNSGSTAFFNWYISSAGKLKFDFWTAVSGASAFSITANTVLTNGNIYHVAVTYEATTGVSKIYLNGAVDGSGSTGAGNFGSSATGQDLTLAYGYAGTSGPYAGAGLAGAVDEAAYYGTALSAARILAHYTAGTAAAGPITQFVDAFESVIATSGLVTRSLDSLEAVIATSGVVTRKLDAIELVVASSVLPLLLSTTPYSDAVIADTPYAYWRLEEASGPFFPTRGTIVPAIKGTPGRITSGAAFSDRAINFPTVSDYLQVGALSELPPVAKRNSFSWECWFKVSTVDSDGNQQVYQLFGANSHVDSTSALSWDLIMNCGGVIPDRGKIAATVAVGSTRTVTWSPTQLMNNAWHHAVGTFDGTNVRLYVDGAIAVTTGVSGSVNASTYPTVIGIVHPWVGNPAAYPARAFPGLIDEVAFYDKVLTSTQVNTHYQAGLVAPPPANDLWVWNGTTEVPANVTVWNGTSELASSVSVT